MKLRIDFAIVRKQWLHSLSDTCSEGSDPFLLSRMVIVTYIHRSIGRWETSSENLHVHKDIFQRFFSSTLTFSVFIVYTTLQSISLHWWWSNNHRAPSSQSPVWHCWSSLNNFVWISTADTSDKNPETFFWNFVPEVYEVLHDPVMLIQHKASLLSADFSSKRLAEQNTPLPAQPCYLLFQAFTVFGVFISTFIRNGEVLLAERRHAEN